MLSSKNVKTQSRLSSKYSSLHGKEKAMQDQKQMMSMEINDCRG